MKVIIEYTSPHDLLDQLRDFAREMGRNAKVTSQRQRTQRDKAQYATRAAVFEEMADWIGRVDPKPILTKPD